MWKGIIHGQGHYRNFPKDFHFLGYFMQDCALLLLSTHTGRKQGCAHYTERETEAQSQPTPAPKEDEQQSWGESIQNSAEFFPSAFSSSIQTTASLFPGEEGDPSGTCEFFSLFHQDQGCCMRPIFFPSSVFLAFIVVLFLTKNSRNE